MGARFAVIDLGDGGLGRQGGQLRSGGRALAGIAIGEECGEPVSSVRAGIGPSPSPPTGDGAARLTSRFQSVELSTVTLVSRLSVFVIAWKLASVSRCATERESSTSMPGRRRGAGRVKA